jgi:transcriptional regulator with XRE-family HTH domain
MTTKFDELMSDPEFRKLYAIEGLIADASQFISDLLERRNMKQADLARVLNKTPAFVSQLLSGKTNITVRTLAEVAHALGASVKIEAVDEEYRKKDLTDSCTTHVQVFKTKLPRHRAEFTYRPSRIGSNQFVYSDYEASGDRTEDVA